MINLDFANITVLPCLFFFFSITDLCFLYCAGIAQILNPVGELVIPIGILNKEAKAEIGRHPVIAEVKIRKCS